MTGTVVLTALQAPGQNSALGPLPATQPRTGKKYEWTIQLSIFIVLVLPTKSVFKQKKTCRTQRID